MSRIIVQKESTQTQTNMITTTNGETINVVPGSTFSSQIDVDVNTPAAKNFPDTAVDVTENTVTIADHGFITGLKGQLTSTGTLPGGLSLATDYFIIVIDANTIQFASSLANALASTPVDITDQGSGGAVNTFTPTALAGATVLLEKSNDGETWITEGSATNITVDATLFLEKAQPTSKYLRTSFTITAGSMTAVVNSLVKGPN